MAVDREAVLAQLRKGFLSYCVLAVLREDSSYGLELASRLGRYQVLFESDGKLYPVLSRLREQGWVVTHWQESVSGPPRRYYRLTDAGRGALATFLEVGVPFLDDVKALLAESAEGGQ